MTVAAAAARHETLDYLTSQGNYLSLGGNRYRHPAGQGASLLGQRSSLLVGVTRVVMKPSVAARRPLSPPERPAAGSSDRIAPHRILAFVVLTVVDQHIGVRGKGDDAVNSSGGAISTSLSLT